MCIRDSLGSGLVLQGLACWAVDDFSTVFAPPLTMRIPARTEGPLEGAARSEVAALQRRSPAPAMPDARHRLAVCRVESGLFSSRRPGVRSRPAGPLCGDR